jgi:RNA polymerase sigma-70 factor (sigma-E family)
MRNEEAIEVFVSSRRVALFRSAYLLCGDRDEADDLVQSTLVKVVLGWRRLERLDDVEAYARKTLVNTFIASRRRFWRREAPYAEPPAPDPPTAETEDGIDVRSALVALTPHQRAVIVLRYWEDLTVGQTAAALNMRENTVKSHAARGLAVLRAHMGEVVA